MKTMRVVLSFLLQSNNWPQRQQLLSLWSLRVLWASLMTQGSVSISDHSGFCEHLWSLRVLWVINLAWLRWGLCLGFHQVEIKVLAVLVLYWIIQGRICFQAHSGCWSNFVLVGEGWRYLWVQGHLYPSHVYPSSSCQQWCIRCLCALNLPEFLSYY